MATSVPPDWEPTESPSTPPPTESIQWVESELRRTVTSVEMLVGGLSSAVHRLVLAPEDELPDSVVLRRYTLADWIEREPHVPHDEARNLAMLSTLDLGVLTPELVAADPDGRYCDAPAVLMTEVTGRPIIAPVEPTVWAEKLATCLARIHEQSVVDGLPEYRRWDNPARVVPTWTDEPGLWHEAKRRVSGDLPAHDHVFLHRDFHPNNIHWVDDELVAVVDWLGACNGPVAGDLSHCRWNIAVLAAPNVADHFTAHYRQLTGYSEAVLEYDLATVLSGPVGPFPTFAWNALGRDDLTSESVAIKIDTWLAHVLTG